MREQATGPSNTPLRTAPSFGRGRLRLLGRSFLLLLAATALQAAPASAIVYVMPTDESMVDRSPIIVFGEVLHAQPSLDLSRPATDYLFAVEEAMKGFLAGSAIIVRQPGGIGADGTAMSVVGLPMLSEGSRVLLFLQPEVNGAHGIVEYGLGTLFEARVGDRVFLLREPSLQGAVALPGGRASSNPGGRQGYREAGAFRHWIADRAAGVQRPSDYFEAELPDATAAVASPFRLLQEECAAAQALPVQPPNFDRGETIAFEVQSGGQPGVQGDGVSHVRTAMRVWNTYPGSNVNLEYAGTTASPPRLYDGANSITFEDPHDEIEGSFVPGEGGTLALATTWWTCGAGRGIGGLHAHDLRRTSLTTQDGFQSYLRQFEASTAERIFQDTIAHELGHALDLDEACEPDQSRCDPSRERRGALMWPENDPGSGLAAARRPSMAATESGLDLAIESPDSTEVSVVPSASSAPRDPAADFDLSSGNGYPFGIVYAESRFHVVDRTDRKVYAYRGSDGRRDPAADFDLDSGNANAYGITYAQSRFYIVDRTDKKVYAYRGSDGRRDAAADFDLHSGNANPYGITHAEGRFHVVDRTDGKVYAYRGSDGRRDAAADFNLNSDNSHPYELAYAQGRFYVADRTDRKVYVYPVDGSGGGTTAPDLVVESPRSTESSVAPGGAFRFAATVRNNGDERSAATTLRYYRSSDSRITTSDTRIGSDAIGALSASATDRQSIGQRAPATPGTYYYGACVDSVPGESDTTNNCSSGVRVTVSGGGSSAPDLVVSSPSVSNSSPSAGGRFTLRATVRNQGDGRSASTTLRYYRSSNSTISTSDTQVGTDAVGALSASGSSAESISLTAPSSAGTYYYGACVDSVSGESSTGNNCSQGVRITVAGGGGGTPGDAVTAQLTQCSASRSGSFVNVTMRGTLRANRRVTNVTVTGYANGRLIGTRSTSSISAGSSWGFSISGSFFDPTATTVRCSAEWRASVPARGPGSGRATATSPLLPISEE